MKVHIAISIGQQRLTLTDDSGVVLRAYPVSTAANGPGEQNGSYCTPRGRHLVRAKIGAGEAENTIFVGRRPSGELRRTSTERRDFLPRTCRTPPEARLDTDAHSVAFGLRTGSQPTG